MQKVFVGLNRKVVGKERDKIFKSLHRSIVIGGSEGKFFEQIKKNINVN